MYYALYMGKERDGGGGDKEGWLGFGSLQSFEDEDDGFYENSCELHKILPTWFFPNYHNTLVFEICELTLRLPRASCLVFYI